MHGDRANYFMFKSAEMQADADRFRHRRNMPAGYARDRLHATILPLPFERMTADWLCRIHDTLAGYDADPLTLRFDRFDGQSLRSSASAAFRLWREALKRFLHAAAIPFHDQKSAPHVSLTYDIPPGRAEKIEPIVLKANELLLIESVHGVGHIELGRWPLVPRQGNLFD